MKQGKMFFIPLQKLFSFSRKSNFRISDIQIPWRHQMPKHNLGSKYGPLMKFGQFMPYCKRKKKYEKVLQKLRPEN